MVSICTAEEKEQNSGIKAAKQRQAIMRTESVDPGPVHWAAISGGAAVLHSAHVAQSDECRWPVLLHAKS